MTNNKHKSNFFKDKNGGSLRSKFDDKEKKNEVDKVEPNHELFEQPKPQPKEEPIVDPRPQSVEGRFKVTSRSAWMFKEANTSSKGVAQVNRGNLINVISEVVGDDGERWFEVSKPISGGVINGFIQSCRGVVI